MRGGRVTLSVGDTLYEAEAKVIAHRMIFGGGGYSCQVYISQWRVVKLTRCYAHLEFVIKYRVDGRDNGLQPPEHDTIFYGITSTPGLRRVKLTSARLHKTPEQAVRALLARKKAHVRHAKRRYDMAQSAQQGVEELIAGLRNIEGYPDDR